MASMIGLFLYFVKGGILPPMFCPNPDGSGPQLTLHQVSSTLDKNSFSSSLTIRTNKLECLSFSKLFSRGHLLYNFYCTLFKVFNNNVCHRPSHSLKIAFAGKARSLP
jgi:hypothetical protein